MSSSTPDNRLDCAEVVRALWEYLDGRTGPELARDIDEHLARCEGCRAHFDFEERLVRNIAGLRREHSDPVRLRERVRELLAAAGLGRPGAS